jgi:hypothetical protein
MVLRPVVLMADEVRELVPVGLVGDVRADGAGTPADVCGDLLEGFEGPARDAYEGAFLGQAAGRSSVCACACACGCAGDEGNVAFHLPAVVLEGRWSFRKAGCR